MSREDFCRDAKWIEEVVTQIVMPFGWAVEVRPVAGTQQLAPAGVAFEYTFTLNVTYPASHFHGQQFKNVFLFAEEEWFVLRDPKWVRQLPLTWARKLVDQAMRFFADPPLPAAGEVDWRPTETVPEDFYAM